LESFEKSEDFQVILERQLAIYFTMDSTKKLEEFSKLFRVSNKKISSDISKLVIGRGDFATTMEELEYANSIVSRGKIMLSSEKLKEDLTYYVKNYLARQPTRFYEKQQIIANVGRVFPSFLAYALWVDGKINPSTIIQTASELSSARTDPHIYQNSLGNLYIVQNVFNGELNRALHIAVNWAKSGENLGYQASSLFGPINYTLYSIIGRDLRPQNASAESNPINILQYPDEKYAALLEITS
jgi:hypothetical protein